MCDQTAMCKELGDDRELLALLKSDCDEGQAVLDHIESCSMCQQRLDSLAADQSELEIAVDVLTHRGGFDSELRAQSVAEAEWSEAMAMTQAKDRVDPTSGSCSRAGPFRRPSDVWVREPRRGSNDRPPDR